MGEGGGGGAASKSGRDAFGGADGADVAATAAAAVNPSLPATGLREGMAAIAALVPSGVALWSPPQGAPPPPGPVSHAALAALFARTYALRREVVGVDAPTALLVATAARVGLTATLAGSGGAVVCVAGGAPSGGGGELTAAEEAAAVAAFEGQGATFRRLWLLPPGEG